MKSAIGCLLLRSGAALPLAFWAAQAGAQTTFNFTNSCGNGQWTYCCGDGLPCGDPHFGSYTNNWWPNGSYTCPCPPLPGPADEVHIDAVPVTCNGGEAGMLFTTQPLNITFNLYVYNTAIFDAPVTLGGYVGGGGTLTYNQAIIAVNNPGQETSFGPGVHICNGPVTMDQAAPIGTYGDVHNNLSMIWPGNTAMTIDQAYSTPELPGGILRNSAGALFLATGDGEMRGWIGLGHFLNSGTFRKDGGFGQTMIASHFESTGLVDVRTGSLRLAGQDSVLAGTATIAAGCVLEMAGSNAGMNDLTVSGPGTLLVSASVAVGSGKTATIPHVHFATRGRAGPGIMNLTGTMDSESSAFDGGTTNLQAGATGEFRGDRTWVTTGAVFNNYGTLTWTGASIILDGQGVLNNREGGILDCRTDQDIGGLWDPSQFNNYGTFRKTVGTSAGHTNITCAMLNSGTVEINAGRMGFAALTQTSTGRVILNNGILDQSSGGVPFPLAAGRLEGNGEIWGHVENTGGTLSPGNSAGTLHMGGGQPGNYTQGPGGTFEAELGGASPGIGGYDQLLVDWQATLDGTLNVSLINGFTPSEGQVFYILVAGSRSGEFSTVNLPPGMVIQYTPTEVILLMPASCDPDVNCDGGVNGFDIEATEQAINGDFSNFCQASADLNGDGAENGFDIETEEQRVNGAPC
ncbi:hypothetical protein PHYC_00255 [Phycisphaerales bacterium]|nr:hypothetical protein PHYC_00255 [Phycisphaerales bacterium]